MKSYTHRHRWLYFAILFITAVTGLEFSASVARADTSYTSFVHSSYYVTTLDASTRYQPAALLPKSLFLALYNQTAVIGGITTNSSFDAESYGFISFFKVEGNHTLTLQDEVRVIPLSNFVAVTLRNVQLRPSAGTAQKVFTVAGDTTFLESNFSEVVYNVSRCRAQVGCGDAQQLMTGKNFPFLLNFTTEGDSFSVSALPNASVTPSDLKNQQKVLGLDVDPCGITVFGGGVVVEAEQAPQLVAALFALETEFTDVLNVDLAGQYVGATLIRGHTLYAAAAKAENVSLITIRLDNCSVSLPTVLFIDAKQAASELGYEDVQFSTIMDIAALPSELMTVTSGPVMVISAALGSPVISRRNDKKELPKESLYSINGTQACIVSRSWSNDSIEVLTVSHNDEVPILGIQCYAASISQQGPTDMLVIVGNLILDGNWSINDSKAANLQFSYTGFESTAWIVPESISYPLQLSETVAVVVCISIENNTTASFGVYALGLLNDYRDSTRATAAVDIVPFSGNGTYSTFLVLGTKRDVTSGTYARTVLAKFAVAQGASVTTTSSTSTMGVTTTSSTSTMGVTTSLTTEAASTLIVATSVATISSSTSNLATSSTSMAATSTGAVTTGAMTQTLALTSALSMQTITSATSTASLTTAKPPSPPTQPSTSISISNSSVTTTSTSSTTGNSRNSESSTTTTTTATTTPSSPSSSGTTSSTSGNSGGTSVPMITSAAFSTTGEQITFTFDQSVSKSEYTKQFSASELFTWTGSLLSGATALWVKDNMLVVSLSSQSSINLTNYANNIQFLNYKLSDNGNEVVQTISSIAVPSEKVRVLPLVLGATQIGPCDGLELDASIASNPGEAGVLKSWVWQLVNSSLDVVGNPNAAELFSVLNATVAATGNSPRLVVPSNVIPMGESYIFSVAASNRIGKQGISLVAVRKTEPVDGATAAIASVGLLVPGKFTASVFAELVIEGYMKVRTCGQEAISAMASSISWTIDPSIDGFDPATASQSLQLVIPAGTMEAETTYRVVMTATIEDATSFTETAVETLIVAEFPGLELRFVGGSSRSVAMTADIVELSVVAETTPPSQLQKYYSLTDLNEQTNANYTVTWTCSVSYALLEQPLPCSGVVPPTDEFSWELSVASLEPQVGAGDVITVTAAMGNNSATVSLVIDNASNPPLVTISGPSATSLFQTSQRLRLLGNATVGPGRTVQSWQWSVDSGDPSILSPNNVVTSTTFRNLVLRPYVLTPGMAYTLQLTVVDSAGEAGFATITINTAPISFGGTVTINPTEGVELATVFTVTFSDWTDASAYSVAYEDDVGEIPLKAPTAQPTLTLSLPRGADGSNVLKLRYYAWSPRGGTAEVGNAEVIVTPNTQTFSNLLEAVDTALTRSADVHSWLTAFKTLIRVGLDQGVFAAEGGDDALTSLVETMIEHSNRLPVTVTNLELQAVAWREVATRIELRQDIITLFLQQMEQQLSQLEATKSDDITRTFETLFFRTIARFLAYAVGEHTVARSPAKIGSDGDAIFAREDVPIDPGVTAKNLIDRYVEYRLVYTGMVCGESMSVEVDGVAVQSGKQFAGQIVGTDIVMHDSAGINGTTMVSLPNELFAGNNIGDSDCLNQKLTLTAANPYATVADHTTTVTPLLTLSFATSDGNTIPVNELPKPIIFCLPLDTSVGLKNAHCAYWDDNLNRWSKEGCEVADPATAENVTQARSWWSRFLQKRETEVFCCRCNHTTDFSVLVDTSDGESDEDEASTQLLLYIIVPVVVGVTILTIGGVGVVLNKVCTNRRYAPDSGRPEGDRGERTINFNFPVKDESSRV